MTNVLLKRGNVDTDMHIGTTPYEGEGRNPGNATEAKEGQRQPADHQMLGQEAWNRFFLIALRRN